MKLMLLGPRSVLAIAAGIVVLHVGGVGAQQRDSIVVEATPSVTLEDAVARALQRSPAMAQASQQVDNAAVSRRSAWGAFLPSLSASSGASLRSTERFDRLQVGRGRVVALGARQPDVHARHGRGLGE